MLADDVNGTDWESESSLGKDEDVGDKLDPATRKKVSRAGGLARKARLTAKRRSEIAAKAARVRWAATTTPRPG